MRMRMGTERGNVALPPNPAVFVARIEERQCHVWPSHNTAGILGQVWLPGPLCCTVPNEMVWPVGFLRVSLEELC